MNRRNSFPTLDLDSFMENINNFNPIHLILDTCENQLASEIILNLSLYCQIPTVTVQTDDMGSNANVGSSFVVKVGHQFTNIGLHSIKQSNN